MRSHHPPRTGGDACRRRIPLLAGVALVLAGLTLKAAAVAPPAPSFDTTVLDGVTAGPPDAAGRVPYTFAGGRDWPAIRRTSREPLDWRAASALVLPVENRAATPFALLLRLDDRPDATGDERSLSGVVTVPPHAAVTIVLPLAPSPPGMRGKPPAGLAPAPGDLVTPEVIGGVETGHVTALHISGVHGAADQTLLIGPAALRPLDGPRPDPKAPLADRYGQALAGQWPEKVRSDAELKRRLAMAAADTRALAARTLPTADRFGGLPGPSLAATGFFRAARIGRRWSLVTPAGHPFFSLGPDVVTAANPTVVAGRESLFEGLPGAASPLAAFDGATADGRRTFDVGSADLARGLGPAWRQRWPAAVVERLRAWGFNTLGNWSDPALGSALPHVAIRDVEGGSSMVEMGGRALVDPFDPAFVAVADEAAAALTAPYRADPGLIGYFSGNELPWGEADRPADGVTAHVLAGPADSPARQVLMADLRGHYHTREAFAAAWAIPVPAGWATPIAWPEAATPAALADADRFESRFAERYFATVAAALRRHDPNHLYLGTRFAADTPAAVRACARFCDVVSFNIYGASPELRAGLWRSLDRPVLIGEFHFGSLDRGSFWPGMASVAQEADRGPAYAAYLEAAVADPAIVGAHWYQYADEPLTGRPFDGENGHLGLVAVTDVPYAGFVAAVAAANRATLATFSRQTESRP